MRAREIGKIVQTVCNAEYRCPVFEAMSKEAGGKLVTCDPKSDCPLRKALNLYAEVQK